MPGTNLTREEARLRSALVTVQSYDVALDLTAGDERFHSTTTLRFTAKPGGSTWVDLVDATNLKVTLNGTVFDAEAAYLDSRIGLADLAAENTLVVEADLPYSHSGEGLHRFVDPADGKVYLYSQFEVPDARRVFATFEQPDLKSVFTFTVTAPEHWLVISNTEDLAPTPAAPGAKTWHFPTTVTMPVYITAFVAGEYHAVYDEYVGKTQTIRLGHFCRQSKKDDLDADELFELTKQGFAFYEEAFDFPYPFGKYDQAYVPEYNMGAMENAGCVTFRDEYLPRSKQTAAFYEQRANTVLHEMAHMWFGDLVTMRWWDDLWLNESFAEWASHWSAVKATKFTEAWTGFTNGRKNWALRQDQLPSTHPIAADNFDLHAVEANFDGITYAKGASTLKQLVAWVGEEDFLKGLRAYFQAHQFGNAEFKDLLDALSAASGRELDSWATEWLTTAGVNTFAPVFEVDAAGAFTAFAVRQTAAPDHPTIRRHRAGIGLYSLTGGRLARTDYVEVDIVGELTEIPALVGKAQPDLVLLNDQDLTYAKIRLDERSLATLVEHIDAFDDSLARALCWGAAWDMTRDAEMKASDFVRLVLKGVGVETDLTAVGNLLGYARTAVNLFSDPAKRGALRDTWEAGLWALLEAAAPGSDHQLALTRAFAAAAHTPAALDRLQGLHDGSLVLDGLDVSQDVRWTLLTWLAAQGRADEAAIEAELARDSTISGQEKAAAARTVVPTPEAKATAWSDIWVREDLPNETLRQICVYFQVPGQEALLAPYVDRYFDGAATVLDKRSVWIGRLSLEYTFPSAIPTAETLAKADAWLAANPEVNPTALRYVKEGRADLARALAAQAKDAE